jgi:hypothetical protein
VFVPSTNFFSHYTFVFKPFFCFQTKQYFLVKDKITFILEECGMLSQLRVKEFIKHLNLRYGRNVSFGIIKFKFNGNLLPISRVKCTELFLKISNICEPLTQHYCQFIITQWQISIYDQLLHTVSGNNASTLIGTNLAFLF